jgi:RecA/RadA recombinase
MEQRRRRKKLSEQVEESANKNVEKKEIDISILIPSGSTMLNLACSDNPFGAFALGRIVTLPGGSASGKTMLMLTMLAKCANDKRFDNYNLIYDDGEETCDGFDIKYLFGNKLVNRIIPPQYDEDNVLLHSETIQDFKANILTKVKAKESFIYILDSLDSLTTDEELKKEYRQALIKAKDPDAVKELKGSYKTEKAKAIGETLRMINNQLKHTKSALFIVQQERANIGVMFGPAKTTSGGLAPYFYSTHQVWLNKKSTITKEVKKLKRKTGNSIIAKVTKNKITGKLRDVEFDTYYDYGVDDLSSCIDFLVSVGHWKKTGPVIIADDLDLSNCEKDLIKKIEERKLQNEVQVITGNVWLEIEESLKLSRERRFI